eukprot:TRINITY_DN6158_c0_g1_i1.p1 TRINITY_DN6158_c0_g1~~TRINITY_DN6158_c0_g1_i1.p1  ORF type:complete len:544 (+),score=112.10 TRINITY_DN6158_c0_g1_i1:264-1895(+)
MNDDITFDDVSDILLDREFLLECGSRERAAQERLDTLLEVIEETHLTFSADQFALLLFGWLDPVEEVADNTAMHMVPPGGLAPAAAAAPLRPGATNDNALLSLCASPRIELREVASFIVRQLLESSAFVDVLHFDFFPTLRGGVSRISRQVAIEFVVGKGGLLQLVSERCCEPSLLLLYYFLSSEFYEAANVWSGGMVVQSDHTLTDLCSSLLEFSRSSKHPIRDYALALRSTIGRVSRLPLEEHEPRGPIHPQLHMPSHTLMDHASQEDEFADQMAALKHQMMRQTEIIVELQERLHQQQTVHNKQILAFQEKLDKLSERIDQGASISVAGGGAGGGSRAGPFEGAAEGAVRPYEGEVSGDNKWSGLCHPSCKTKRSYALMQSKDGRYTAINKASGAGYVALCVDNHPKMVVTSKGLVGVGTVNPTAPLHVAGAIKSGDGYACSSSERLHIVRGGFSCRTADPASGPGYAVKSFGNGMFEIHFATSFVARPNVVAVQHITGETPTLIPLGFVDASKFGFYEISRKPEVWIEFTAMGSVDSDI